MPRPGPGPRTAGLTAAAMAAFAANSILCRMALAAGAIDPASFTAVRLASGALVLAALARLLAHGRRGAARGGGWVAAGFLFLYAAGFSLAYVSLAAGTGALILFGAVQATMIAAGLLGGERPPATEWAGFALAVAGLVYLASPGLEAPPLAGALLMAAAGVAWGLYSLSGLGERHPVAATAANFARAVPFVLPLVLAWLPRLHLTPRGVLLAVLSGALASGLGYVVWYAALAGLGPVRAAMVQLTVPVLAALGGVALLDERITPRLVLAAVAVLGGVALAIAGRRRTGG